MADHVRPRTSPDEEPDPVALGSWLRDHVGGDGEVHLERIGVGAGVANVLHGVEWAGRTFVMRRPPSDAAKLTASAGNMQREARSSHRARPPRTCGIHGSWASRQTRRCSERRSCSWRGSTDSRRSTPYRGRFSTTTHGGRSARSWWTRLADVALVDWKAVGLGDYGKPGGFLARQVDRWLWQLDSYRTRPLPHLDEVIAWLRAKLPSPGPVGLMHGDYSLFNVMFAWDSPARLAAIIDWDTSTIGEPLMDFGHLLARWDEPGEEPTTLGSGDIADRQGLTPRAEMMDRYQALTGFDLSNIRYYEVLSLFKLGCIMEGHYANEVRGVASGGRFANSAPGLFVDALRIANGERV